MRDAGFPSQGDACGWLHWEPGGEGQTALILLNSFCLNEGHEEGLIYYFSPFQAPKQIKSITSYMLMGFMISVTYWSWEISLISCHSAVPLQQNLTVRFPLYRTGSLNCSDANCILVKWIFCNYSNLSNKTIRVVFSVFKNPSDNVGLHTTVIQSQLSHKIKGPDGTRIQSKGVFKHTFDQDISHNRNKLLWKDKIFDDCRITTAKFRRAAGEMKTDSKQEPSGLKQENTTKKSIALGQFWVLEGAVWCWFV